MYFTHVHSHSTVHSICITRIVVVLYIVGKHSLDVNAYLLCVLLECFSKTLYFYRLVDHRVKVVVVIVDKEDRILAQISKGQDKKVVQVSGFFINAHL